MNWRYIDHMYSEIKPIAQKNFPESWEDRCYITNAASIFYNSGYESIYEVPQNLLYTTFTENGII
ncbi:hypothetical protein H924_03870 [Corynebacterium callunae DSM 20147]|uniref:Uncharacterized protein n=1 Tax=Corynebacterium callunae DSM 20147 TaxID=1121353 RepID=M1UDY7_9CORY|nr:hypothetical protein H924_03870 [Corynebacterium callunae DSM 20147]